MRRFWFALLLLALSVPAHAAPSTRSLDDYRHFRIAAIDLLGRMPTREEVAELEKPTFDFDRWIDAHLSGPAYTERLTRIYMDLLRLEPNLNFSPALVQLYRHEVDIEGGGKAWVYYRQTQRRVSPATDSDFCFSPDEIGVTIRGNGMDLKPEPLKPISKKLFAERTVAMKPWWLYRDYKSPQAKERYQEGWKDAPVAYKPVDGLLKDLDGKPAESIFVCREEAALSATGHVYVSGRAKLDKDSKTNPGGRYRPAPIDKPFATQHKNEAVTCESRAGIENAVDCGCGIGLERCIPGVVNGGFGPVFTFPNKMPLGPGSPLDLVNQTGDRWFPYWWSREAVQFLDDLFAADRDFRLILTGHQTMTNGPLAQFYRSLQRSNCCGPEATFGMVEEDQPLFDPKNVPADLLPHDVDIWKPVADRGPHAAGILSTPMFLHKYATPRARGAVLYNAFLCKSFIAENAQLTPSTEPNLMKRPGCQTCHATLEPLAAYFARVEPSSSVFLPASHFPALNTTTACKKNKNGILPNACGQLYDVAFSDDKGATLRSAYGSLQNADAGPEGAGKAITAMPEFAECAVQRVTSSFLGRPTSPDDTALLAQLQKDFVGSGYRMKTLVRGIVRSAEYLKANNMSSSPPSTPEIAPPISVHPAPVKK